MWAYYYYALAPVAAFVIYEVRSRLLNSKKRLPPGPKPKFLIGNLFDVPQDAAWKVYAEWGKKYGRYFSADQPFASCS